MHMQSPAATPTVIDHERSILCAEKTFLKAAHNVRRAAGEKDIWKGLGLSGGGIRAATFSLGALQALTKYGILSKMDYISTVSGGGYIGSSLQWWWCKARQEEQWKSKLPTTDSLTDGGSGADQKRPPREHPTSGDPAAPLTRGDLAPGVTLPLPQQIFGTDPENFPYGCEHLTSGDGRDTEQQKQNLAFLRNHGNYLDPGNGISLSSGLYVVLRTVLLSLTVWLPLLLLCFLLIGGANELLSEKLSGWGALYVPNSIIRSAWGNDCFPVPLATPSASGTPASRPADQAVKPKDRPGLDPRIACKFALQPIYAVLLCGYCAFVIVFILISMIFALLTRIPSEVGLEGTFAWRTIAYALLGVVLLGLPRVAFGHLPGLSTTIVGTLCYLFGTSLLVRALLDLFRLSAVNGSYWWRRTLEIKFGNLFIPSLGMLIFGLLPILPYFLAHKIHDTSGGPLAAITALVTTVSGAGSAFYGYYAFVKKIDSSIAARIFAPLGAAIFLYGTLTIAYVGAIYVLEVLMVKDTLRLLVTDEKQALLVQVIAAVSILVACCLGLRANINFLGLHRFYRDRLMEAFMPSAIGVMSGRATYSPIADRLSLSDLKFSYEVTKQRALPVPFPIINTFARISRDKDPKITNRGGDNFILTPLHVGSRSTGWEDTATYVKRSGPLTLATAMAASGAAVNSNAGYIGTGLTRDWFVSAAMTILNMRLGIWVKNPAKKGVRKIPLYVSPTITSGLFGFGFAKTSAFIELSDGGNFENLGLYELVRRRVGVIVIVDGEADPTIALPALVSAAVRIKEDFNATLTFLPDKGPERLMPSDKSIGYPSGAQYASSPYMIGSISYAGHIEKSVVLYMKATLIKGLGFTTAGYRAENPDFPHQTTADQFFDPMQFEAYRDLGYRSATLMIKELGLENGLGCLDDLIETLEKPTTEEQEEAGCQVCYCNTKS
jgi:hypothetical protein